MKKIRNDLKSKKAITLISLVVTIVVLVILAAVAINMAIGNNGLLNKTKLAKEEYVNSSEKEKKDIDVLTNDIDIETGSAIVSDRLEKDWEVAYEGAIESISNLDISKYKEIRCAFMRTFNNQLSQLSQFGGWNQFDTKLLKDGAYMMITIDDCIGYYVSVRLEKNNNKLSYNATASNCQGWNFNTYTLRIEGR